MNKKKMVLNAGIYDLMHLGHLNLLRRMRKVADVLVIVVHDDRSSFFIKDKIPIQNLAHRISNLNLTGLADIILTVDSIDPAQVFKQVIEKYGDEYDITYMRGDDLTADFPGKWMLDEKNIPINFLPYTKGVSSTEIKKDLCS